MSKADEFWSNEKEATHLEISVGGLLKFALDAAEALPNAAVVRVSITNEDLLDMVRHENGLLSHHGGRLEKQMRVLRERSKGE